jgi:hypothetical protein
MPGMIGGYSPHPSGINKGTLAQRVKEWQRAVGPTQKQHWHNFCATKGTNTHDPSRHDASVLAEFVAMTEHAPGMLAYILPPSTYKKKRPEVNVTPRRAQQTGPRGKKVALIQLVKNWQRKGDEEKKIWQDFCARTPVVFFDPSRYEETVLERFLSEAGQVLDGGIMPAAKGGKKEACVKLVKEWQRMGEEHQTKWHAFCECVPSADRPVFFDPLRYDEAALTDFLTSTGAVLEGRSKLVSSSPPPPRV